MNICRDIAGFSYGRADIIRRAMSKKKATEMENERHAFIFGEKDKDGNEVCHGAIAAGISEEIATEKETDLWIAVSRSNVALSKNIESQYGIISSAV